MATDPALRPTPYRPWVMRVLERHPGALYWDVMNTFLVVGYAFLFTSYHAHATAVATKLPTAPRVRVEIAASAGAAGPTNETATMVGTTAKFLFLYFPERDSTHVLPFENVLRVVSQARPERRRRGISRLIERMRGAPEPRP